MNHIKEFQLIDHGVDGSQYFQGCGVSCTGWNGAFTGFGSTFQEALDDAIEQACEEWLVNVDDIAYEYSHVKEDQRTRSVCEWTECEHRHTHESNDGDCCEHCEACELHYYITLMLKEY